MIWWENLLTLRWGMIHIAVDGDDGFFFVAVDEALDAISIVTIAYLQSPVFFSRIDILDQ